MARGAKARGKRAAFGDGKRIIWGPWCEQIFRNNLNIAKPGSEQDRDLIWIDHYKGHRLYNSLDADGKRWVWNMEFRAQPGQVCFDEPEKQYAKSLGSGFILIEPNVPWIKSVAVNKDWGLSKYQAVANRLRDDGHQLLQFTHGRDRLSNVGTISVNTFRQALVVLSKARLYIGPEGGLHHGSAALGIPGVVLFGGFIPPEVTGYEMHTNLTGGATACGSLQTCPHCRAAMAAISVDDVYHGAHRHLHG